MANTLLETPFSLKILRTIANTTSHITFADTAGGTEFVWILIQSGEPATYGFFIAACTHGHTEIVRLLLAQERCVDSAAFENRALRFACLHGLTEIVRLLLELPLDRGVDPAANGNEALQFASECGHTEIVRLLLDLGVKSQ